MHCMLSIAIHHACPTPLNYRNGGGPMHKHDGVQTDQELTQLTGDLLYELGAWLWAIGLPRPSPHVAFGIGAGTMCVNHCTWASMFCFHVFAPQLSGMCKATCCTCCDPARYCWLADSISGMATTSLTAWRLRLLILTHGDGECESQAASQSLI